MSFRSAVALLLLYAAGCERFAHQYAYRGTLLHADGTPAAGAKVSVLPFERFYYYADGKRLDIVDDLSTVTDQHGQFSGRGNGPTTYVQWLSLPRAPAPELSRMYVWVHDGYEWSRMTVPLTKASQRRGFPGGRQVDLPAVTLPPPTRRHPASRPAGATSPG